MSLYSAIVKITKRTRSKSYYNSDHILTAREKQMLAVSMSLLGFPIIISIIMFLVN